MTEYEMWTRRAQSAQRRCDQDVRAGRRPSKDDTARVARYTSLALAGQTPVPTQVAVPGLSWTMAPGLQ